MKTSNFLSLLKTLKPEEIDGFDEFLRLYHNRDKTALRIFQYAHLFQSTKLQANKQLFVDYIYQKTYKEALPEMSKDLKRKKMKKLQNKLSLLTKWLKDFLWYQKINFPSMERDLIWSTILMEREQYEELSKHRPALKEKIKETTPGDIPGYLKQMVVSYLTNYRLPDVEQNPDPNFLSDFIAHLDSFYVVTRLKLACEMATRKHVKPEANAKVETAFQLDNLMALLPSHYIQNTPLVSIYAELFVLVTDKSRKSYEKVEALLKAYLGRISREEQHDILVFLQNYAADQIRSGNTEYLNIVHELNVFGVNHGCFTKDGIITANHYTNIINSACKAGALDWAWDFATMYSPRLAPAIRKNVTNLGEAIVLFEKKDYAGVLSTLPRESFSDTHCEIRSRSMLLRSAWELKKHLSEYDYVLSYCLAFEQYLVNRDKKNKSDIVTASLNFVRVFKKMTTGHKSKAGLIEEIQSYELLYFRKWLLEKNDA